VLSDWSAAGDPIFKIVNTAFSDYYHCQFLQPEIDFWHIFVPLEHYGDEEDRYDCRKYRRNPRTHIRNGFLNCFFFYEQRVSELAP
jgi:hypothetical protein